MKSPFEFLEIGPLVDGDLELVAVQRSPGNPSTKRFPWYGFEMRHTGDGTVMGSIRLRIGPAAQLRYPGHIGYEVNEAHRGHCYAARSCRLLLPLARAHGLKAAWLTVDPKNTPSIRTCEIIGAKRIETIRVPKDHEMYAMGARFRRRYRLDLVRTPPCARKLAILAPHSPRWRAEFESLRAVYAKALGPLALRIEHVGSTAVRGLCAKPILDIDIVIAGCDVFPRVAQILDGLGYRHNGDQGIAEREAFVPDDILAPRSTPAKLWMTHHLYVCPEHSRELQRHVRFRNALRASPRLRAKYETIKQTIVARCGGDRSMYVEIKENEFRPFFEAILNRG